MIHLLVFICEHGDYIFSFLIWLGIVFFVYLHLKMGYSKASESRHKQPIRELNQELPIRENWGYFRVSFGDFSTIGGQNVSGSVKAV